LKHRRYPLFNFQSQIQIQQNLAKEKPIRDKKQGDFSLDFLGFPSPNLAFSMSCGDP
jgi:hypothetical protein